MTRPRDGVGHGRPREFNYDAALDAALQQFWRQGYAATSLDELTAAMGLSRSSFYGAFGSKHDVLLASVTRYVDGIFSKMESIAVAAPGPMAAVQHIVDATANPHGGPQGCLLVNSIAELAPGDEALCALARMHIGRVVKLLGSLLIDAGEAQDAGEPLAGAILAFVFGATTLRKAGLPEAALADIVRQAKLLLRDK